MSDDSNLLDMHAGASAHIFRMAAKLRAHMTEPEKALWEFLRIKPEGYKFRRQHPFGNYVLDFYCHKKRLSIEIDGENHNTTEQIKKDNHRTQFLIEQGIKEIRFKNSEVITNLQTVKNQIGTTLREASL